MLCHGEKECHEMEQLREDKMTLCVKQAFCKVNNKIQQLRGDNTLVGIVLSYKQGEAL